VQRPARPGGGQPGGRPAGGKQAGPARGGAPAAEGEEEEEEEPTASVLRDNDAVILRDGSRIDGTVLCAGQVGVTILSAEGEKTIPRAQVERVVYKTDASHPETLPIEEEDGHKYVRDYSAAPAAKTEEPPIEIVPPAAPAAPAATAPTTVVPKVATPRPAPAKPATPAIPRPAQPRPAQPRTPRPATPRPVQPNVPTPPNNPRIQLPENLGGMVLPDNPADMKTLIKKLKQEGKLDQVLNDPKLRKAILDALRKK
jgi:hypothetical protein